MENHQEAYLLWKRVGFFDSLCVHIDTHLDVSNFLVPSTVGARVGYERLNCANFLAWALREGIVTRLIWVVPPHVLPGLEIAAAQAELERWLWMDLSELESLQPGPGWLQGRLLGRDFWMVESGQLKRLLSSFERDARPWLLDIDIDYFFDLGDQVWQSPQQLASMLTGPAWDAVTVADSVEGGYTPESLRSLGDECERLFLGREPLALHRVWKWLDRSYYEMQRGRWEAARAALLQEVQSDPRERLYLRAYIELQSGSDRPALELFEQLLACQLDDPTRAHVEHLCSRCALRCGEFKSAIQWCQAASQRLPQDASLVRAWGQALQLAGQFQQAARLYRRALEMAPGESASVSARAQLVRCYLASGQRVRAQGEIARLRERPWPVAIAAEVASALKEFES